MIVVDASAAVSALLNEGPARTALSSQRLSSPHLIDAEVANAVRRQVAAQRIPASAGRGALATLSRLGMRRYPVAGLLGRIWELRESLSAYDACYIALAEALSCDLLTADARLGRAADMRCAVTVVPR